MQERSVLIQFKNGNPFPYDLTQSAVDLLLSLVMQCEIIKVKRYDGSFDVIWTQNIARITVGRLTECEQFSKPINDGMIDEYEE
jgi:hypothetical protein